MQKRKDLVVKDNSLIQASYTLSLVEARLILLAIVEARETGRGITPDSYLEVHADHYANQFSVTKQTAYQGLADAVSSLFNRQVTIHTIDESTGKPERQIVRWVSGISYVDDAAKVKIRFSPDVVPLITRLEANFTSYTLEQISELQSSYAVRLYELLIQWRSVTKTPLFKLADFRNQLGVDIEEYPRMDNFKRFVLDLAIYQINKHTDINVCYEQQKEGRVITGFIFNLKLKKINPKKSAIKIPPVLEHKNLKTSKQILKEEAAPRKIKIDARLEDFLALSVEEQEQLRKLFSDSLSSPLKEMWKKSLQEKIPNPELKPLFTAKFIEMIQSRDVLKEIA